MAESAKFSLKLLVDEKRNKVVLAEADQDFVDFLFGLLTLPMGTIARLLEKHQKLPQVLSCYKNLNKSVADMVIDDFQTEACKSMLMHPKSTNEIHCRRLKMNIDDIPATKFYVCQNFCKGHSCSKAYSNFNSSRCIYGSVMYLAVEVPEYVQVIGSIGNGIDGVFFNSRSSFIVTDDMKVMPNSIGEIVKVVNGLGYSSFSDLREMVLEVGSEEVLSLLGNLFASESALTCTFLKKQCMTPMLKLPSHLILKPGQVEQSRGCSVYVFVRNLDKKILYAECSEDFIDSLFTFLVLPLDLASSLSNDNSILGCVKNLSKSGCRGELANSCCVPYYYTCSMKLLDINCCPSPAYECSLHRLGYSRLNYKFAKWVDRSGLSKDDKVVTVCPMDPKISRSVYDNGFVKRKTKFIVSDDLIITPMNKFSTIGLLKKMETNMDDLEAHSICIYKAELINILKASLTSTSALTNGLSYLLSKEPKKRDVNYIKNKHMNKLFKSCSLVLILFIVFHFVFVVVSV